MITSRATRSRTIRRCAAFIGLAFCFMILPAGCGETGTQKSSMPSAEFAEKLEKDHPELFVKKVGKGNKTEVLGGRDKRAIIREEWLKSQQGAQ